MPGERGLAAARRATVKVVRRHAGQEEHRGEGLLLDLGEEGVFILTCHHVIAPCSPDELFVRIRQGDGELGDPIPAEYVRSRSRPERDAVVLQLGRADIESRSNPLLHAVNQEAYNGHLRATGVSYLSPPLFTGEIVAGDIISVEATPSETWPLDGNEYRAWMFPLSGASDARQGISGGLVVCEHGVLGLAESARKEGQTAAREVYVLPLSSWAKEWPALDELIEPLVDDKLRSAARVKQIRDLEIGSDIVIDEYRANLYIERSADLQAEHALHSGSGVIVVGKPESGKTRLAYQLFQQYRDGIIIMPVSGVPPDAFEHTGLIDRSIILFFDDLHRVARTHQPLQWLVRLRDVTNKPCLIICTSRDGVEWREEVCQFQGQLLDLLGAPGRISTSRSTGEGEDLSAQDGLALARMLGLSDEQFAQRFDGTPGSLTLDLGAMRDRYLQLRTEDWAGVALSRLIDSVKVLHDGRQPRFKSDIVRAVAERVRGDAPLTNETWDVLCVRTKTDGFGEFDQEGVFRTYLPYLSRCVSYLPSRAEIEALFPILRDAEDIEGLLYLSIRLQDWNATLAEAALRIAGEGGIAHAYVNLGNLFQERGDLNEAEQAYLQAAASGIPEAKNNLGVLLSDIPGREGEAERYLVDAVAAGLGGSAFNLGLLLSRMEGRESDAEAALRSAVEDGIKEADLNLGGLLALQGGHEVEAEQFLRRAAEHGEDLARLLLGVLLAQQPGRGGEAEEELRAAISAGVQGAHFNLGSVLGELGRVPEAESEYRQAIGEGDRRAYNNLGILLAARPESWNEAEEMYRKAAESGFAAAYNNLGILLMQSPGREADAEAAFREALEAGTVKAAVGLGSLVARDVGRWQEAEALFRLACEAEIIEANNLLGRLLMSMNGRSLDAIDAFRRGADAGDPRAQYNLGLALARTQETRDEGCQWLLRAANAGIYEGRFAWRQLCNGSRQ